MTTFSVPHPNRASLWPIIVGLACLVASLLFLWWVRLPPPNRNQLALGERATLETLDIPLQSPIELDFATQAEVFRLRTEAVFKYPDLIIGGYRPANSVFGQIEDGLPWWGTLGNFYYGSGEKSIEGPAGRQTAFVSALQACDYLDDPQPVVHTTGKGYADPPGLKLATSQLAR